MQERISCRVRAAPEKGYKMDKLKINRINELARASKVRELTPDEKAEQQALRDEYRAAMRASLIGNLESTVIVNPDGTRKPLKKN